MLLDQILSQGPDSPALLLRRDPHPSGDRAALVRDVLAAANADAGPVRYVLFGAEESGSRIRVVGLTPGALDRVRDLVRGLAELIEPPVQLTPLFAEVEGKPVAALEIRGCDDPPYTLRQRVADAMRTGACWVRADGDFRPARREDLERIYARRVVKPPPPVDLGLDRDPCCLQMQLTVPDTSRPPSQRARAQLLSLIDAKRTAEKVLQQDDAGLARLFGASEPFVARGVDTLTQQYDYATDQYVDADNHYFYEQQAVQLQLTVRNNQPQTLVGIEVELSLPVVAGFDVADRLYADTAGGRSSIESRLVGYPEVEKAGRRASVRTTLGTLDSGRPQPLFEAPLRIRVGPEMRGMKIAITYLLTARELTEPVTGRLKLVFNRKQPARGGLAEQ
jgi:hypothetical protein